MPIKQGKARFVKILGNPVDGYNKTEDDKQWEFDLELSDEDAENAGPGFNVKVDQKTGAKYVKFTRKAYKKDGTAAKPIAVVDDKGKDWDRSVMIGNGSTLNVLYDSKEWEFGRKKGVRNSVIKVQVWDHVEYKRGDDLPIREDDQKPLADDGEVWN